MSDGFLFQVLSGLAFLIALGGLIFFHELGHFVAAVRLGVKVKEFGIGFPPRLVGTARDQSGRRRWFSVKPPADLDPDVPILSLNWILLGGFVRPAGEDDPTVPDGLAASSKRVRLTVLAAGPAANLLIGFLVFTVGYASGWPTFSDQIRISHVVAGTPADQVGLLPGDVVLTANGEPVTATNNRLSEVTYANVGKPVALTIKRGGQILHLTVTPRTEWPENQGPMGVQLEPNWTLATYPLPEAAVRGAQEVVYQVRETALLPARLIVGQIRPNEVRFISVVGLKTINDAAVDTALALEEWFPILKFVGTISVALALTNLLPLPALDGGRILFVLVEAARGQRLAPEREGYVHIMGLFVLLMLMAFLIINDLMNPVLPR